MSISDCLVINDLISHIQNKISRYMFIACDIVLYTEIRVRINYTLELCREALESKDCKINKIKLNIWIVNLV